MEKLKIVGTKGRKKKEYLTIILSGAAVICVAILLVIHGPWAIARGAENMGTHGEGRAGTGNTPLYEKMTAAYTESEDNGPNKSTPGDTVLNESIPNDTVLNESTPNDTVLNESTPNDTVLNESISSDIREVTVRNVAVGTNIVPGDFIDIRLMRPDGTDYVVVSKKELIEYNEITGVLAVCLGENELLTLNSAMIENAQADGIILYAVKYVDPGNQEPAVPSYIPNEAVSIQIKENGK